MRALVLLVPLLLLLPGSGAQHCSTWTTSVSNEDTFVLELPLGLAEPLWGLNYFVVDLCSMKEPCPTFLTYAESNGIAGLQRGDWRHDDTCHGLIQMDTLAPY